MGSLLVIAVRWHAGRYDGAGGWPPSPARLFQALVAGLGSRAPWNQEDAEAFHWLERLDPPGVAVPAHTTGQGFLQFLPNNDLDVVGGDPRNISKIRGAKKWVEPILFDERLPTFYAWNIDMADERPVRRILGAADALFQLGRGADMAWAWGEVMSCDTFEELLSGYAGRVLWPARHGGRALPVPTSGSFDSLRRRYAAYGERFLYRREGRRTRTSLRQVPPPTFALAGYDASPGRLLFELRRVGEAGLAPQPIEQVVAITNAIRDAAADRLASVLPEDVRVRAAQVFTGRPRDGTCPIEARVRVIPLASIGHDHADGLVRRILVEIPDACPTPVGDIEWALSGLELEAPGVEAPFATLTVTTDDGMLGHHGIGKSCAVWRTVTPVALSSLERNDALWIGPPGAVKRRLLVERDVARALRQAVRHAGVSSKVEQIRVQKEPLDARGRRAEDFATARFIPANLWHVEIRFAAPRTGPLVLGDGRFLGLGVMAPWGGGEPGGR